MDKDEFERLKQLEAETRAQIIGFKAADNLPRDQLHERGVDVRPAAAAAAEPQPGRRRVD